MQVLATSRNPESYVAGSSWLTKTGPRFSNDIDIFHDREEMVGILFLKDGNPVQPDPDHFEDYIEHRGQRRGHWPTTSEITHEMLKHYERDQTQAAKD